MMEDLEKKAIERIKMASEMSLHYYKAPLVCTYSGGKDSDVLLELFKRSGVPFELHSSHTTVDAPETVYHIRNKFKDLENQGVKCEIQLPEISMWELIPKKKTPPSRIKRYCCKVLKETGCANRYIATGVRWDESESRKSRAAYEGIASKKENVIKVDDEIILMNDNSDKRRLIEHCELKSKSAVNPIIDWRNSDIWDYIRSEKIQYNPLYDRGYYRVGCIGCPIAGKGRWKEFSDYPTYKRAYIRAFDKMIEAIHAIGKPTKWKNGYDVFLWWMEDKNIPGQYSLFEDSMDGIDIT